MIKRSGEFLGNVPVGSGDTGPNIRENAGPNPPGTRALRSGARGVSYEFNRPHAAHVANTDYLDWVLWQEMGVPTIISIDWGAAKAAGAITLETGSNEIVLSHAFFDSLIPAWSNGRVFHGDVDTPEELAKHFSLYDGEGGELCDFTTGDVRIYGVSVYTGYGNPVGNQAAIAGPSLINETLRHGVLVPPGIYTLAQPGDVIELTNAGLINTGQYIVRRVDPGTGLVELMGFSAAPTTDDAASEPVRLDIAELGEATLRTNGKVAYRPTIRLSGELPVEYQDKTIQLVLGLGVSFPVPGSVATELGVRSAPPMTWAVLKRFMEMTWEDITAHTPYEVEDTTLEKANNDLLASNLQTAYDQSLGKGNSNNPGTGRVVTVTDGPVRLNIEPSGTDGHRTALNIREETTPSLCLDLVNADNASLPFINREYRAAFTVPVSTVAGTNRMTVNWVATTPLSFDGSDVREDGIAAWGDGRPSLVPFVLEIPRGYVTSGLYYVEKIDGDTLYLKTLWGDAVSFVANEVCAGVTFYAVAMACNWDRVGVTATTEEEKQRSVAYRAAVDAEDHTALAVDLQEVTDPTGEHTRMVEVTARGHIYAGGYPRDDMSVLALRDHYRDDSRSPVTILRAAWPDSKTSSRTTAAAIELPILKRAIGEGAPTGLDYPRSPLDGLQIRSHVVFDVIPDEIICGLDTNRLDVNSTVYDALRTYMTHGPFVGAENALALTLGSDYYLELSGCQSLLDNGIYRIRDMIAGRIYLEDPLTGDSAAFNGSIGSSAVARIFVRDLSFRATGNLIDRAYMRIVVPSYIEEVVRARGIDMNVLDPDTLGSGIRLRGYDLQQAGANLGSLIEVATKHTGSGACYSGQALTDASIEAIFRAIAEDSTLLDAIYKASTASGSLVSSVFKADVAGNLSSSIYEALAQAGISLEAAFKARIQSGVTLSKAALYALIESADQKGLLLELEATGVIGVEALLGQTGQTGIKLTLNDGTQVGHYIIMNGGGLQFGAYIDMQAENQYGVDIRMTQDNQVGMRINSEGGANIPIGIGASGQDVFQVKANPSGINYGWVQFENAYGFENFEGSDASTGFLKLTDTAILGAVYWSGVGIPLPGVTVDIDDTEGLSTEVRMGSSPLQNIVTMAGDPEGQYRKTSGASISDTALHKMKLFPFWSGNRPYIDRVVPVTIEGYVGHESSAGWTRMVATTSPVHPTQFAASYAGPARSWVACRGTPDGVPLLLPVRADPGAVISGARIFIKPVRPASVSETAQFVVSIYREPPVIWEIHSPTGGELYPDEKIGWVRDAGGKTHSRNAASALLGVGQGNGVGPHEVGITILAGDEIEYPLEVNLLDDDGDPVWAHFTVPSTPVVLRGSSGGYYEYEIVIAGEGSKRNFIHSHRPGFPAGSPVLTLANLSIPFLGDYLWIYESAAEGMYPIVDVYDSGSDLVLRIISSTPITSPVSGRLKIPAIINPGTVCYFHMTMASNTDAAWDSLYAYPGLAYIRSYNDMSAAGFPSSPTSGIPFPYSP